MALLGCLLAACADEAGPSFAPDAATESAVSALTPTVAPTAPAIDRQPGELADVERTVEELAAGRGGASAVALREGAEVTVFTGDGQHRAVQLTDPATLVAVAPVDGSSLVTLRRLNSRLTLEQIGLDGSAKSRIDLPSTPGDGASPPAASPAATAETVAAVTRDRVEVSADGGHAAVITADGVLWLVSLSDGLEIVRQIRDFGDVSALGWGRDGAMVVAATFDSSQSSASLTGVPLEGRLQPILRLAAGDGRRIVYLAAPAGSDDVFFVARSDAGDWSAQNSMYRVPVAGGPATVVLGPALAGPAGAIDRLAVTDDGRTVAASVLTPRGDDLAFHSLWITDIETARPLQVETGALGLVSRLAWTTEGLLVVGAQRERSASESKLVTVGLRLEADGSLRELARQESPATPIANPVASPAAATPVASPTG